MDLEELLSAMDRTAANLAKLERVWEQAASFMPSRQSSTASGREYDDLVRAWADLLAGLPTIDGWTITDPLPDIDELDRSMFQTRDAGVSTAWVEDMAAQPGKDLAEYRHRLNRARRRAARDRLRQLQVLVDTALPLLVQGVPRDSREQLTAPAVGQITAAVTEIERLMGDAAQRLGRWSDLYRHIRFGQGHDWHDIAEFDWPSVRVDVSAAGFSDTDPLPVPDADLGQASAGHLTGQATTALEWSILNDDGFERLLFDLLRSFPTHQNVQLLSHTRAADRGRDLSMDRMLQDSTGGMRSERVIIQAKHWLTKSVNLPAVSGTVATVRLWDAPVVRALIIATSGRFSSDAVMWAEKHNDSGNAPFIELWPDSKLEVLLAQKPHIAAAHGLR
ncbi:restriction endonuclease [Streptomyces sp. L500]